MKYVCLLLLMLPLLTNSYPAEADEKIFSLDDVTVDSDLAASDKESQLHKRSGSGSADYALHIKQGFLSSLGHASASIASGSSGGSSGGGSYKSYGGDGHHGNSVDYSPWSLKKTVLNTIFQAVKAITGGVTAIKGQLIKGSGYALSASGHVAAASGDKITDVGKYIINSAHSKLHPFPSGGGGGGGHPLGKLASFSGASSGGSSSGGGGGGGKHPSGPVVHTESITAYEIPSGHSGYGPPSKPPTFSSATHQYLPPSGSGGYAGGGAGYGGGHVAFEAPSSNYLATAYGPDASNGQEFNIYGRHHKLTDEEARKAAVQLQEILGLLPNGKTEYTASKTIILDTSNPGTYRDTAGYETGTGDGADLNSYGLPNDLGPLKSLSHTEQISAAYGAKNPHDLYHEMRKQKQTPEEIYIEKHPNEAYDHKPTYNDNNYKYDNYHAVSEGSNKNSLNELTPIIAALEVAKQQTPPKTQISYAFEKHVHKTPTQNGPGQYLPPAVHKNKYIYYQPTPAKYEYHGQYNGPAYNGPYKVKRNAVEAAPQRFAPRTMPVFAAQEFDNHETLLYNSILRSF